MKKFTYNMLLVATIFLAGTSLAQAASICKVTDPTGTPLNIRDAPNGKVINQLRNGREVIITNTGYDNNGRTWVYLEGRYKGEYRYWGWAIREFVSCYNR